MPTTVNRRYQWIVYISVEKKVMKNFVMEERESQFRLEGGVEGWRGCGTWGAGIAGVLASQMGLVFAVLLPDVVRSDERPLEGLKMVTSDR